MSDVKVPLSPQAIIARIRELNESIIKAAESAGADYLEGYEHTLAELADLQKNAMETTPLGWVTTLASTQAKFVQRLYSGLTDAARATLA
jgi:hypothetical protein